MRRMINCSAKTLEDLCLDSELWNTVVKHTKAVRIKEALPELSLKECASLDSVWTILDRAQVQIVDKDPLVKRVETTPQLAMSYPKDLFILDQPSPKVNSHSLANGVVMVSSDDPSLEQIIKPCLTFDFTENTEDCWERCFITVKDNPVTPINSLILIDRYLFGYDYATGTGFIQGIANFRQILNSALPKQLNGRFDLLVVFSIADGCLDSKTNLNRLVSTLAGICKSIRPYKINFEALAIRSADSELWDAAHDRRIITNYYRILASHGFKALMGKHDNICIWSQTITVDYAYTGLDTRYRDRIHYPIETFTRTEDLLARVIRKPISSIRFFKNGYVQNDFENFENRLVVR